MSDTTTAGRQMMIDADTGWCSTCWALETGVMGRDDEPTYGWAPGDTCRHPLHGIPEATWRTAKAADDADDTEDTEERHEMGSQGYAEIANDEGMAVCREWAEEDGNPSADWLWETLHGMAGQIALYPSWGTEAEIREAARLDWEGRLADESDSTRWSVAAARCNAEASGAMVCDYRTGADIRPATEVEFRASIAEAMVDGGAGAILVADHDGPVYVRGGPDATTGRG